MTLCQTYSNNDQIAVMQHQLHQLQQWSEKIT